MEGPHPLLPSPQLLPLPIQSPLIKITVHTDLFTPARCIEMNIVILLSDNCLNRLQYDDSYNQSDKAVTTDSVSKVQKQTVQQKNRGLLCINVQLIM